LFRYRDGVMALRWLERHRPDWKILWDPPRRSSLCLGAHFHQPERPGQCRPIAGQADNALERLRPDWKILWDPPRRSSLCLGEDFLCDPQAPAMGQQTSVCVILTVAEDTRRSAQTRPMETTSTAFGSMPRANSKEWV
jgi:hypothetical protein